MATRRGTPRPTAAQLRKTIEQLQRELETAHDEIAKLTAEGKYARRYIDATTGGIMHAAGVVRWVESLKRSFGTLPARLELALHEADDHAEALNTWIGEALALKGQLPPASGE